MTTDMQRADLPKPNFFILGAGKSGSTSIYHYMKGHPQIFLPRVKEPSFFCEDFQVVKNPVHYFQLFDQVSSQTAIGEASHVYLSNPSTPRVLKTLFPDARFIIILRNPANRAYSLYHHMRRTGFEPIGSFEKALEAEEDRATSARFKGRCPQYLYNYLYFRSGLYGQQIERYFSLFPKKQFLLLKFEQFIQRPEEHFTEILRFLDVDEDFHPKFDVYNDGGLTARFPKLEYLVNTKIKRPLSWRKYLLGLLSKHNRMNTPGMDESTRERLFAAYSSDLRLLREMTGIGFDLEEL
ncbi:MAG: sulfotransferase [Sedimenticolaceae bacterium]